MEITLLSEIFVRRKFRGFAIFLPNCEIWFPRISRFFANREISFREFLKYFGQLRDSSFENLEILMNGLTIKYDHNLKVGKEVQ